MISREELARRCSVCNPPISDAELEKLQAQFDNRLPESLVELLRVANGFEIESGDGVSFFGSNELFEMNEAYGEYCPQHILIAMTGGSECALISRGDSSIKTAGDPGALLEPDLEMLAPSLDEWPQYEELFPKEPEPDISSIEPVHIYLEQIPPGGLKDLAIIKNALPNISSVAQIKTIAQQLPAVLSKQFVYVRACSIIRDLGTLGDCLSIRLASDPMTRLPLN